MTLAALMIGAICAGTAADPNPSAADELEAAFAEVQRRLEMQDIATARTMAEDLRAHHGDGPVTRELLGRVKFYEGDYAGAVELLTGEGGFAKLARSTLEEVKDYDQRESAHFIIRFPKGKDELLASYALETLEATYRTVGQDLRTFPEQKVRVEVLKDAAALARMSPLSEQEILASGTIALCKYNKLMITTPRALLTGYSWQDTLAHEFTHYLITRRSDNTVPIWLHEGIAKFEESRWQGPAGEALSPESALRLKRRLAQDNLITFAQMHPSMALLPTQDDAALAFAEVFTAIEYLVKERGGLDALNKLLDRLKAGATDSAAIEATLGQSLESFQSDWKAYLRRRPLPKELLPWASREGKGEPTLAPERLRFKSDPKGSSDKRAAAEPQYGDLSELDDPVARRAAHLGELLQARKRISASLVEYARAEARVGARSTVLSNRYAEALIDAGQSAQAVPILKASLIPYPHSAQTHLHLGQAFLQEQQWALARQQLLAANAIDPFDPEIHRGLLLADQHLQDAAAVQVDTRALNILHGG
jgi:tetratricopeptide (TPR) repeat protein